MSNKAEVGKFPFLTSPEKLVKELEESRKLMYEIFVSSPNYQDCKKKYPNKKKFSKTPLIIIDFHITNLIIIITILEHHALNL